MQKFCTGFSEHRRENAPTGAEAFFDLAVSYLVSSCNQHARSIGYSHLCTLQRPEFLVFGLVYFLGGMPPIQAMAN
jgi:hypothetical protein